MNEDDIIVPRQTWQGFLDAFEEMVVASKSVQQPVPPDTGPDPEIEIHVDRANGHDDSDGSIGDPVKSFRRMTELLQPRTRVIVAEGYYREQLRLIDLAERLRGEPIWIKAESPGAATLTATSGALASGQAEWRSEDDGVWSAPQQSPAWAGFAEGRFLFAFKSVDDLRERAPVMGINKPDYGLAHAGGRLFVRLPGGVDPEGRNVIVTQDQSTNLVVLQNSPRIILDGFRFAGAGKTFAVNADERSMRLTIRNCQSELCRILARIASDSTIDWCRYHYPGFLEWAEDVAAMNGDSIEAVFALVKKYRDGDYEGRLATGAGIATRCVISRNLIGPAFDGRTSGQFSDLASRGNVTLGVLDDGDEAEDWDNRPSRNLRSIGNWTVDAFGSDVSIQPKNKAFKGPADFHREVFIKRHPLATPAYCIKIMGPFKGNPEITFDRCFFHNVRGRSGWGMVNWLWLDDERAQGAILRITNSVIVMPDGIDIRGKFKAVCDHNFVVSTRPHPEIQGPNGRFVPSVEALGLIDFHEGGIDVRPTSQSPLIGAGSGGFTVGPFEPGNQLLPRPMEEAWTDAAPFGWAA